MGPKKKTRAVSGDIFGGSAADLPESDLPTHRYHSLFLQRFFD
jgi:hypothetical protein